MLEQKGVWWTKARTESYIFPEHYIGASIIGIAFRTENKDKIKSLEDFAKSSGKLVPIAPQSAQYRVVENFNKEHPNTQIKLVSSDAFVVADAYQWVIEGRYDAYFDIRTSAKKESDYNILHICGYEGARNDLYTYADYDVKVVNFAANVEKETLSEGQKLFGGRTVICGFANTVNGVLYKGTKEEIQAETKRILDEAGTTQGIVIGADCTIPDDINFEHLEWVREAANDYLK